MKKFIFVIFIFILLTIGAGGWVLSHFHAAKNATHENTKAPQTKITIIEGWGIQDIAKNLDSDPNRTETPHLASAEEFLSLAKNFDVSGYPILRSKPAEASLEGFIFPDTYFLPLTAPSSTTMSAILLKKSLDNFSKKFTPEMEQQASLKNMSVFQIVTLASIIEKETGRNAVTEAQKKSLEEQRKIIAGIFYNRLRIGMPLDSDATINYITKKNDPTPSANDLATASAYNTYLNRGLPPGPIGNPSLSSLLAALYPAETNYLYFLHKQPSGEPVYSTTFEEHIKNKQKYLQ